MDSVHEIAQLPEPEEKKPILKEAYYFAKVWEGGDVSKITYYLHFAPQNEAAIRAELKEHGITVYSPTKSRGVTTLRIEPECINIETTEKFTQLASQEEREGLLERLKSQAKDSIQR